MTKRLLILGGGFGLYGYMPAALSNEWQVTTLDRYRNFLNERAELKNYIPRLNFVSENDLNLEVYDGVVIARTPSQQSEVVSSNSTYRGHYFLEKPLGINAKSHAEILRILENNKTSFSVGYLFRYQDWYLQLVSAINSDFHINIEWNISKNTPLSWKDSPVLGGGLLSYFGIHMLSLIVDLGFDEESLELKYRFNTLEAESLKSLQSLNIKFAFSDFSQFQVQLKSQSKDYSWNLISPFGSSPSANVFDPRILSLTKYLESWKDHSIIRSPMIHELKVLKLRQSIEQFS